MTKRAMAASAKSKKGAGNVEALPSRGVEEGDEVEEVVLVELACRFRTEVGCARVRMRKEKRKRRLGVRN